MPVVDAANPYTPKPHRAKLKEDARRKAAKEKALRLTEGALAVCRRVDYTEARIVALEEAAHLKVYRVVAPRRVTEEQLAGHIAIEAGDGPTSLEYGPRVPRAVEDQGRTKLVPGVWPCPAVPALLAGS